MTAAIENILADPAFKAGYQFVLGREVGYHAPDSADPHPTLNGVTQETYDSFRTHHGSETQPVEKMSDVEQEDIYAGYWISCGSDKLATAGLPLTAQYLFDIGFNEGTGTAIKMLQECLGLTGAAVDGVYGPATASAVQTVTQTKVINATHGEYPDGADGLLVLMLFAHRVRSYATIWENNKAERSNFPGWIIRSCTFLQQHGMLP